jgi:lysophospholipase L1-like esterase
VAAYVLFLLVLAESFGQAAMRITTGVWPLADRGGPNHAMFQDHPYLIGVPRPGAAVRQGDLAATIDSLGFRGADVPPLPEPRTLRILALGGSTTFGVGVDDAQTWPVHLQGLLDASLAESGGPFDRAEVINGGVPGYTSVENIIQLSLLGSHLRPHIVIVFQGLNDLRVANSPGFRPDYANFHALTQRGNLELDRLQRGQRIALVRVARTAFRRIFETPAPALPGGAASATADSAALATFADNLRSLAGLCSAHDARCVFVPQVATAAFPMDRWWLPYVPQDALSEALSRYNDIMQQVATETAVPFVGQVIREQWGAADFRDYCHFSGEGGARFASILQPALLELAAIAD